jgi:uncharacterized protein YggE
MKKYIPLILTFTACLTCAFAGDGPLQRRITVSGSGDVNVAPDEVFISVGVETRNANLDEATRQNNEQMKNALGFLKSSGVPAKDIKTDYITLETESNYGSSWSKGPTAYVACKSIEIKLSSLTNLETTVTGLLNNGVNRIHNIDFETTQFREYRDQARALAIHAAREKAEALAKELGMHCGKAIDIDAKDEGGQNWYSSYWRHNYNVVANASQDMGDAPEFAGKTLSLGQIKISASVTVSFELE